jgi:5-methylcytosine-specific restriction endonuclease McrA
VLDRDQHRCQVQIAGRCRGHATQVDHIRAISEGGDPYDMANLRASCKPCNSYLGAKLGGARLAVKQQRWSRVW